MMPNYAYRGLRCPPGSVAHAAASHLTRYAINGGSLVGGEKALRSG
jgi:hypothetical protein